MDRSYGKDFQNQGPARQITISAEALSTHAICRVDNISIAAVVDRNRNWSASTGKTENVNTWRQSPSIRQRGHNGDRKRDLHAPTHPQKNARTCSQLAPMTLGANHVHSA